MIVTNFSIGWLIVTAYFVAALLAIKMSLLTSLISLEDSIQQKRFWLVIAFIMFLLGFNKQLDILQLLTVSGRDYALREGWYKYRRTLQIMVMTSIAIFISITTACLIYQAKSIWKKNWLTITALLFLLLFVSFRSISFHYMDSLINTTVAGLRINGVLELSGIFCISYSCLIFTRKVKKGAF